MEVYLVPSFSESLVKKRFPLKDASIDNTPHSEVLLMIAASFSKVLLWIILTGFVFGFVDSINWMQVTNTECYFFPC